MLDSREWEYKTPEYIIDSLTLPMNYTNPWYSKDSADGAKAVKNYYYLGTIIYNDKSASSTAGSYDDLSDDEKMNYDEMSSTYTRYQVSYKKQGYSSAECKMKAQKEVVKLGIKYDSKALPVIFRLITGDIFDWQYWYNQGVTEATAYKTAKGSTAISTQGKEVNYAKAVTAKVENTSDLSQSRQLLWRPSH